MEANRKKILIVHLYANGDCLYATAVARQIKKDFPNSHLTWAILPAFAPILKGNPYVDEILMVEGVPKNDTLAFKRYRKVVQQQKSEGKWDELFITANIDDNQALYDGTVRGMILRAYPGKIDVPLQPVLVLSEDEKARVDAFAEQHQLSSFKHVILWEYAPQSGQSTLNMDWVKRVAEQITKTIPSSCVILSSAHAFDSTKNIIDASPLKVRENAALSHHCHLLIGCSSGITWLCTSSAGKMLPMIQLLNPEAMFLNAPSTDFKRYGIEHAGLVEMTSWSEDALLDCVRLMSSGEKEKANQLYNQTIPVSFRTTRKILYDRICFLQFGAFFRHISIMREVYGNHPGLYLAVLSSLISAPFKIMFNRIRKKKTAKKQS